MRSTTQLTPTRGNQYNAAYKVIKRGDFILTKDKNKATAVLIGGDWAHAVQFLGKVSDGEEYECAEMTHHNYTKSDFFDVVKESSSFAIFRCVDFDEEYCKKMRDFCKTNFSSAVYDKGFEMGIRALYCSELIYQADYERRLQVDLTDLRALGRQYISPTGLSLGKNVVCIFSSEKLEPRY